MLANTCFIQFYFLKKFSFKRFCLGILGVVAHQLMTQTSAAPAARGIRREPSLGRWHFPERGEKIQCQKRIYKTKEGFNKTY